MRNIIIAGGGLENKGAQAMTLICICELKKRYPDHRMILLTWDASAAAREKHAMYDLELLEVPPMKFSGAARNPLLRTFYTLRYGKHFTRTDEIYRNTELLVDISGYALGSNWNPKVCNDYLDNLEFALAYDIPVYLLPQSFGPFDYSDEAGSAIDARTRRLFPQIRKIFAREQEGYDALVSRYGLTNVTLTHDMVLASSIEDYSPALRKPLEIHPPEIPENSICLIPNVRTDDNGSGHSIELYKNAIQEALSQGLYVYLTYHSSQDKALCKDLKAAFTGSDRVILLEHDHSCMEFNELVKKFRFVVASRFHAIVHALKNGIPCIAIGWAVKYIDLLNLFGQGAYMFDLRKTVEPEALCRAVATMNENYGEESCKIRAVLPELQKENVFDLIKES